MINVLLSLNPDLASSIAIRYTNELTIHMKMLVQDIHVVDPRKSGSEPGTGWVRKTWENALIESGKHEIRHFMEVEKVSSHHLKVPKVVIGDRAEKILNELQVGEYHLFIEGVLPTLSSTDFYTLVTSRLYRLMPCPVLVVKNLIMPDKAVLVIDDQTDYHVLIKSYATLFKEADIKLDLTYLTFTKSGDALSEEAGPGNALLEDCQKVLSAEGIPLNMCRTIAGPSKQITEVLREYGLVATSLHYSPKKNNPLLEVLGRIPSPVLICWQ